MNILEKTWAAGLPGRIARHAAALAQLGRKKMSKRAIICVCGSAKPCEKSDCQHSTAIALRNREIERINSEVRVRKARAALDELKPGEWEGVMQHFCRQCGGPPDCYCTRDD